MGIGLGEGLLIVAILTLLFGGKKIPELGRTLGASIRGFKEGMREDNSNTKAPVEEKKEDDKIT